MVPQTIMETVTQQEMDIPSVYFMGKEMLIDILDLNKIVSLFKACNFKTACNFKKIL